MPQTLPRTRFRAEPGELLLDRYRIDGHMATGGMGEVWRGTDLRLGSLVAIKFLTRTEPAARRRFQGETEIAARLTGAHVVRVFDRGEIEDVPFLVMEYLEGETLRERLKIEGKLSADATLRILGQVAEALAQAHDAGIVHRDIKPENIFLSGSGSSVVAKLLDFGIAKSNASHQTRSGDMVGTPHYASPEQLADSSRLGSATDCWSLAVVAFECLTGERPFRGDSLGRTLAAIAAGKPTSSALAHFFSDRLQRWFHYALSADPAERPQDVSAFVQGLRSALRDEIEREREEGTTLTVSGQRRVEQHRRWRWGHLRTTRLHWLAWAIGGLLLAAGGLLLGQRTMTAERLGVPTAADGHERATQPGAVPAPRATALANQEPVTASDGRTPATSEIPTVPRSTASQPKTALVATQPMPKANPVKSVAAPNASVPQETSSAVEDELLWSRRK